MDKVDAELGVKRPTGTHHAEQQSLNVLTLVDVFREGQLFTEIPGRQFNAFPDFDKSYLKDIGKCINISIGVMGGDQ